MAAKATYVEGKVSVVLAVDSSTRGVAVGDTFKEGDHLVTAADGIVEIELGTGDIIRLENDTDMTIKSLSRNEKGSTFSIFDLAIGRVKSLVGKLADKDSKFEYHTKAAICGVAGTPPWIVTALENATEIDLLGKKGGKGAVFTQGFDPKKTRAIIKPGFRTIIRLGKPPMNPFEIDPARLRMLRGIPFKSLLRGQILMNNLAWKISIPRVPKGGKSNSLQELEKQYNQGSGISGKGRSSSMENNTPVFYRGKIKVKLN